MSKRRLYGRRWGKVRQRHLAEHPFCVMCHVEGRKFTQGTVVDHIEPHRGDPELFWDPENWQTLCETHHNAAKQAAESTGVHRGCDAHGLPFDPAHHWNE